MVKASRIIGATLIAAAMSACSSSSSDGATGASAAGGGGGSAGSAGAGGSGGFDCSALMGGAPMGGMPMGGGGAMSMMMGMPDTSCITKSCNDSCASLAAQLSMFGMGMMGTGGTGAAGAPATPGGKLYVDRSCNGCHGNQGEGSQGPNLTSSKTAGIGAWTTDEIKAAIRNGKRNDGSNLCTSMPRWSASQLSDADLGDMVSFLQSLTPVDVPNHGSLCGAGAGGATGGGMTMGLSIDVSAACLSCLDQKCPDIAGPLHCLAGM